MRISIALVCASLAACASNPSPVFPPPIPAPVPSPHADAPTFRVGQEWAFSFVNEIDSSKSGGYSQRVERVENGHAFLSAIVNGAKRSLELDENACMVRGPGTAFTPSNEALRFPLFVGKEWTADYVFSGGDWAANDRRVAKVVSFERVETPAGSFDAFRIEATIAWSGVAVGSDAGRARQTAWYAPLVGRVVKERFVDYSNNKNVAPTSTRYELVRYAAARQADQ